MAETISSDSVAQDQIRAFVDRIIRMREEARAIKDDIREIYAEAKANGFDKTILGKVVTYVEKKTSNSAELLEFEALLDLYISAYYGGAGTIVATHTHEAAKKSEPLLPPAAQEAVSGRAASSSSGRTESSEDGQTNSEGVHKLADAVGVEPLPAETNPLSLSNRDVSTDEEASSGAGPQAEALHSQGTGAETLAGRDGHAQGQAASAGLPTNSAAAAETSLPARAKTPDEIADGMGLPRSIDPRCQKPHICGRSSHLGLCADCRGESAVAA